MAPEIERPPGPRTQAPRPHPWDGFLTGPENALAMAGAEALARGEREGLSPLVVHGPSGVGKSRLLAGLVAETLRRRPGAAVALLTAEAFAAACAEAAGTAGGWEELRGRFRGLDLFVMEDLHALARAPLALEELTHTLDALEGIGAAVAASAREGPGRWSGMPGRLRSRLAGGLAVAIDPPGPESRRRYLMDRARSRGVTLAADAVDAVVEAADGYPALDGWLARLALASRLARKPVDGDMVISAKEEEKGICVEPTIEEVARAVASAFGVRASDLRSASRRPALVGPRHLAMLLARESTGLSFASIGDHFGHRDPATVRHACRAASKRLATDPSLASAFHSIRRILRPSP